MLPGSFGTESRGSVATVAVNSGGGAAVGGGKNGGVGGLFLGLKEVSVYGLVIRGCNV